MLSYHTARNIVTNCLQTFLYHDGAPRTENMLSEAPLPQFPWLPDQVKVSAASTPWHCNMDSTARRSWGWKVWKAVWDKQCYVQLQVMFNCKLVHTFIPRLPWCSPWLCLVDGQCREYLAFVACTLLSLRRSCNQRAFGINFNASCAVQLMLPVQLEPNQGPVECHKGVLQMLRNKRDISHSHTFIKISQKQLSTHLRVVAVPFCSTKGLLLHLQFNLSATHPIRPVQPSPWLTDGSAGKGPCIWNCPPRPSGHPWLFRRPKVSKLPCENPKPSAAHCPNHWCLRPGSPELKRYLHRTWKQSHNGISDGFTGQQTFTMSVTRWKFVGTNSASLMCLRVRPIMQRKHQAEHCNIPPDCVYQQVPN